MGLFDSVRRAKSDAQTKAAKLRRDIEELQGQRAALQGAPACRADVRAALAAHVSALGTGYRQAIESAVVSMARQPLLLPRAGMPGQTLVRSIVGAEDPHSESPSAKALDGAFGVLFGAAIVEALGAIVDRVEWPGPEGLPLAERDAKAAKLTARIDELLAEETTLHAEAEAAGLSLSDYRMVPR